MNGEASKLNFLLGNKGLLVDEEPSGTTINNSHFTGDRRNAVISMKGYQNEPNHAGLFRKQNMKNPSHN